VPTIWLLICTLSAGWLKIFDPNVKVGFMAHAHKFQAALDQGQVLAPAKSLDQMGRIIFNDYVDATLCGFFMVVVVAVLLYGIRTALAARKSARPSAQETPYVPAPAAAMAEVQ
jgi:carbon starvation protein CstA